MGQYLLSDDQVAFLHALRAAWQSGRLTAAPPQSSAPLPARVVYYLGYADGAIPAMTGDTPGEGTVVLYEFAWDNAAEAYTLTSDELRTVTAYNTTATAVADGDLVHLHREPIGGQLVVASAAASVTSTCCTLSGLTADDCVRLTRLSASGACDCGDPAVDLLLAYDLAEDAFTTDERVEVCGVEYQPLVDIDPDGQERFGLRTTTGGSGGESTYYASRSCCCGDDCVTFALGGVVCTGTRDCPATAPSRNVIRFSVAWEACPNPAYHGEGWYVVDGDCVELTADPGACADVTAGPFDTEVACNDVTPDPPACLSLTFGNGSGAGTLVISNGTGACVCADGAVPGGTGAGTDAKTWSTTTCAGNQTLTLSCSGGHYALAVSGGATATLVSSSASPFVLVYDVTGATCAGGPTGTYRVTITHP